jgi:hypothetical protein
MDFHESARARILELLTMEQRRGTPRGRSHGDPGVFTNLDEWLEIRQRILVAAVSKRQILRETGLHCWTLEKIHGIKTIRGVDMNTLSKG